MAPCEIEFYQEGPGRWLKIGKVRPGEPPGSMSNNKRGGIREIILFECAGDDSQTTIYRSGQGADAELGEKGKLRLVLPNPEKLEILKTLKRGESYEMEITTDRGHKERIRFSQK